MHIARLAECQKKSLRIQTRNVAESCNEKFDLAETFAWLASDEAHYVNGAVLEVTGGLTIQSRVTSCLTGLQSSLYPAPSPHLVLL
jgi:NAD(P)-dependent dehydrogenase (short-subunit alcohol dehydrogenase family)